LFLGPEADFIVVTLGAPRRAELPVLIGEYFKTSGTVFTFSGHLTMDDGRNDGALKRHRDSLVGFPLARLGATHLVLMEWMKP
jgi:hypothetical protein